MLNIWCGQTLSQDVCALRKLTNSMYSLKRIFSVSQAIVDMGSTPALSWLCVFLLAPQLTQVLHKGVCLDFAELYIWSYSQRKSYISENVLGQLQHWQQGLQLRGRLFCGMLRVWRSTKCDSHQESRRVHLPMQGCCIC